MEVPGTQYPAPVHLIHAQHLPPIADYDPTRSTPRIRALPTRQLHITAGNSPLVPLASLLRAIWTKSAATIKLPYGATLAGAYLAQLAANTFPDHPLTRHLSVLYWPGGDRQFETPLFLPGRYDRIVVWGAPNAVLSVTERAAFTKTVTFNPRYGVSLIGREAFDHLEQVVSRAACDTLIQSQKACIASQIHYLEGDQAQAERYAAALRDELGRWDGFAPAALSRSQQGQLRRMKRGSFLGATWFENQSDGQYRSAVAVMPDEFNIMEHPLCRLIVVRPVPSLERALQYLHPGVATAGVFPEARRHASRSSPTRSMCACSASASACPISRRAAAALPSGGRSCSGTRATCGTCWSGRRPASLTAGMSSGPSRPPRRQRRRAPLSSASTTPSTG